MKRALVVGAAAAFRWERRRGGMDAGGDVTPDAGADVAAARDARGAGKPPARSSGGCSAAGTRESSPPALMMLAALFAASRRRRRAM